MPSLREFAESLLAGIEGIEETVSPGEGRRFGLRVRSVSVTAVFLAEGGEAGRIEIGSPDRPFSRPEVVKALRGLTQSVQIDARRIRQSPPDSVGRLRLNLSFE